jgi:hypothetical protein
VRDLKEVGVDALHVVVFETAHEGR